MKRAVAESTSDATATISLPVAAIKQVTRPRPGSAQAPTVAFAPIRVDADEADTTNLADLPSIEVDAPADTADLTADLADDLGTDPDSIAADADTNAAESTDSDSAPLTSTSAEASSTEVASAETAATSAEVAFTEVSPAEAEDSPAASASASAAEVAAISAEAGFTEATSAETAATSAEAGFSAASSTEAATSSAEGEAEASFAAAVGTSAEASFAEAGFSAAAASSSASAEVGFSAASSTEPEAGSASAEPASTDLVPTTGTDIATPAYLATTDLAMPVPTSGVVAVPTTADDVIATIHAAATVVRAADRRARQAAFAKADPWTGLDLRQPAVPAPVDNVLELLSPVLERPLLVVEQPGLPDAADVVALHRSELEVDFVEPPVVAAGAEPAIPPRFGPGLSVLPHIEFPV